MNVLDFKKMKQTGEKISMITCYDYTSAKIVADSDIDTILVGDSMAMVMHGESSTVNATVDQICAHIKAVRRGAPEKFIVGDLPFLSYRSDLKTNMENITKVMQAGANAIKLEGASGNMNLIKHVTESGIPVMGHIGLTPQFVNQFGGFKVQGKNEEGFQAIIGDAKSLQIAGCFCVVIECVPTPLATKITQMLSIPTIGIGAGVDTDGQVLVMQDMLGMSNSFKPKFLRHYLNGYELFLNAFNEFHKDVKAKTFPNIEESYE